MILQKDVLVLGAGIYGLYAARQFGLAKRSVLLVDPESTPLQRASYVNQARVHHGYHYPRSISTALKSAHYFRRFTEDFSFAINKKLKKIYATSNRFSMVSGEQFENFCRNADIPVARVDPKLYFQENAVDAAFETLEYAFDADKIRAWFVEELRSRPNVETSWDTRPVHVDVRGDRYQIKLSNGTIVETPLVINATYASINQVLKLFNLAPFKLKYEICEMIQCEINSPHQDLAVTVMDGPFFSLMPFGLSSLHTLSAVTFTPHNTSHHEVPTFSCQSRNPKCTPQTLENCNVCPARPSSAWKYMSHLAKKYLAPSIELTYKSSLFAIKPIPVSSEVDDARPTILRTGSEKPTLISVLSGKINTLYDLDLLLT